jgi:hypothetical protein
MDKATIKRIFRLGNHLYGVCPDCGRLLKLTGFWKGIHYCDGDD